MALISKISRLDKIPQILNKKRDAERDAKQQREQTSDQSSFTLKDQPVNHPRPSSINNQAEAERKHTAKSLRKGIGRRVDLFV